MPCFLKITRLIKVEEKDLRNGRFKPYSFAARRMKSRFSSLNPLFPINALATAEAEIPSYSARSLAVIDIESTPDPIDGYIITCKVAFCQLKSKIF